MENSEINKIKESKKISTTDYVYFSVIIILIAIITVIFFHSTSFIVKNINKIFSTTEEGIAQNLDMTRYSLIENKLNLPKNNPNNVVLDIKTEQIKIEKEDAINSANEQKSIKIYIINTTAKDGAAAAISKELENVGFSKSTTESKKMISSTIISIKESKKEYSKLITPIVEKLHPKISTITNPENSEYDAIITIGK